MQPAKPSDAIHRGRALMRYGATNFGAIRRNGVVNGPELAGRMLGKQARGFVFGAFFAS
jgi:hypothetical protein